MKLISCKIIVFLLLLTMLINNQTYASDDLDSLLDLPLAELKNQEVFSVSKQTETAFEAPAPVYVITGDDIRRSGVTNIPDALRMAPGIQVAKMDSNKWSVTSRGFSGQFSNKLLVMIDGRSVYTPLFSGVYWDTQDTMLEDIERIEVIRGPGATIWGTNAVNGIINIITRNSKFTQGGVVTALAGNEEKGSLAARYGGKINDKANYRVYAKNINRGSSTLLKDDKLVDYLNKANLPNADKSYDAWIMSQSGFRVDFNKDLSNAFSLQGDMYNGQNKQSIFTPLITAPFFENHLNDEDVKGGNLVAKWIKNESNGSSAELQSYFDYAKRNSYFLHQTISTFDTDFQKHIILNKNNKLSWGLGARFISDNLSDIPQLNYLENSRDYKIYSSFLQNKTNFLDDKGSLILGSKFEYNDYTGFEYQPSAKLAWLVNQNNTLWASVSRAVRTPSRGEHGLVLTALKAQFFDETSTKEFVKQNVLDDKLNSEELLAYELGVKTYPTNKISLDLSTFLNFYKLRRFDVGTIVGSNNIDYLANNNGRGKTYGAELASAFNINKSLNLYANYSFIYMDLDNKVDDTVANLTESDGSRTPSHMLNLMSRLNLTDKIEFDTTAYYVSKIVFSSGKVDSYVKFDARLAWKPKENIELSLVGQNLFDSKHQEYERALYSLPTEIERSIFAKATFKF